MARRNMTEARTLIPLLRSIASEIRERREELTRLEDLRLELVGRADRRTNEGFITAVQDLDTSIAGANRGIEQALKELDELGLEVPSVLPLVIHIPGHTARGDVLFAWQEGDGQVDASADGSTRSISQRNSEQRRGNAA